MENLTQEQIEAVLAMYGPSPVGRWILLLIAAVVYIPLGIFLGWMWFA